MIIAVKLLVAKNYIVVDCFLSAGVKNVWLMNCFLHILERRRLCSSLIWKFVSASWSCSECLLIVCPLNVFISLNIVKYRKKRFFYWQWSMRVLCCNGWQRQVTYWFSYILASNIEDILHGSFQQSTDSVGTLAHAPWNCMRALHVGCVTVHVQSSNWIRTYFNIIFY